MARPRKPIILDREGDSFVVRFRHALQRKIVRANLGSDKARAQAILADLNRVHLHQHLWAHPPADLMTEARGIWIGDSSRPHTTDDIPDDLSTDLIDQQAAIIEQQARRIRELEQQLERALGQHVRHGNLPPLRECLESWLADFAKSRDPHTTEDVAGLVRHFVAAIGPELPANHLDGQEERISKYIQTLKRRVQPKRGSGSTEGDTLLSAHRRRRARTYILKMLIEVGVSIDRDKVAIPSGAQVRRERGPIRWLERSQAQAIAKHLDKHAPYWSEVWRVQVAMGLRPYEFLTLKPGDLDSKCTGRPANLRQPFAAQRLQHGAGSGDFGRCRSDDRAALRAHHQPRN